MESNKASERRKLNNEELQRRLGERLAQWKLEDPEDALDAEIERAIRARTPHGPPLTWTPRTMESNKVSERRKLSKEEVLRRVAQWKLEEDALDAEIKRAIHARTPHAPSPTSTPRTFLFLGCLPMPLPSVVQQEVLLMVPTFFRKLMGWENWKAAPATKPAGPAGPKAKGFGGEIGNTTATDFFDAFGGRSSDGKTVPPATKPAGPVDPKAKVFVGEFRKTTRTATDIFGEFFGHSSNEKTVDPATKPGGPADPNAKGGLGDETSETAVFDDVFVVIECETVYELIE